MKNRRRIRKFISRQVAAALLGCGAAAVNAQGGLVTWTLKDVSQFQSGESASGFFTLDPAAVIAAPPGSGAGVAAWEIAVTAGTNPLIPSIAFRSTDTGCVVACAQIANNRSHDGGASFVDVRTPLAADNTFYELVLSVFFAGPDGLIFPTRPELPLITPAFHIPASTDIQFAEYLPLVNAVRGIAHSDLQEGGSVVTTAVVPEASSLHVLAVGFAAMGCLLRARGRGRRP